MLVLKGLVGLQRTIQLQLTGWSIDLDYVDIEWFALETNTDNQWYDYSPRVRHPGMQSQVGLRKHHYKQS